MEREEYIDDSINFVLTVTTHLVTIVYVESDVGLARSAGRCFECDWNRESGSVETLSCLRRVPEKSGFRGCWIAHLRKWAAGEQRDRSWFFEDAHGLREVFHMRMWLEGNKGVARG